MQKRGREEESGASQISQANDLRESPQHQGIVLESLWEYSVNFVDLFNIARERHGSVGS